MTFRRPAEPVIGHHLRHLNRQLIVAFPELQRMAPDQGECQSGMDDDFADATFKVTRGGKISLTIRSMSPGFNPNHYQLMAWREDNDLLTCEAMPWSNDEWCLDVKTSLAFVKRITLGPAPAVPIEDVRQYGHWGWLSRVIRWGNDHRTDSPEITSSAWIEPGVYLAADSTHHPYYATLTENGWRVNSSSHTLHATSRPVRPMIPALATYYSDVKVGSVE